MMESVLSHSRWQVEQVRPQLPVADVEKVLSRYNRQWHVGNGDTSRSRVSIGSRQFRDLLLTEMHMAEIRGVRDESVLDSKENAYVGVTHVISGQVTIDSEKRRLSRSNVQIWTSRQPISFVATERVRFLNVLMPERCLQDRVPGFSGTYAVIGTNCPAGQLTASHLTAVSRAAKCRGRLDDRCIASATADIVANLIRSANLHGQADARQARLSEVQEFVRDNLKRSGLKPALIAREFGMSLRSLHGLFAGQDQTLMHYIKGKRLERAAEDLRDPALGRLSITEIGIKWAFSDSAHFSNAFKSRFGESPSAYRTERLKSTVA